VVTLSIKNIKEIEEPLQGEIIGLCEEKYHYFNELFKKYSKNLVFEIIFNKSSAVYKVSASLNLKSKKVVLAEEHKKAITAVNKLLANLKKAVKKQYELERKEYEYKRKRKKS
jgi:ribosome-associated translation inhibitor RaiA